MLVYIGTKFGQNWFSSLDTMACDEWTDRRTDRQTAWARISQLEEHFKTNPMKIGMLQQNLF